MSDEEEMSNPVAPDPAVDSDTEVADTAQNDAATSGIRKRRGDKKQAATDGTDDGGVNVADGTISSQAKQKIYRTMAFFFMSVGTQLIVYSTMWLQYFRQHPGPASTSQADQADTTQTDPIYWVLLLGSVIWVTQVSQVSKHINPSRQTILQMLNSKRTQIMDALGANPVPAPQATIGSYDKSVLENLTWHARMIFSPIWNMIFSGFTLNYMNITSLEKFAAPSEDGECTDNILGVISKIPSSDLQIMSIGMAAFIIGATAQLKLAEVHFSALNEGYLAYFRNTQSIKMLQQAVERATRGAAIFTNSRMKAVFFVNLFAQCLLLFLMSEFAGVADGGESLEVAGAIIFAVLVFERFLVGFQVALISSYVSKSTELDGKEVEVALIDIEKRERVAWHAEMIFYTGMFAVMQSLVCLPGLLTVIPFFKEGSLTRGFEGSLAVSDCSDLEMSLGAKMERATNDELRNFWFCMFLWFTAFMCQMWLTRTHYVQFWRYQKDVIFTMEELTEERDSDEQRTVKQVQWERQRQMMVRIGRLRATGDGDSSVLISLLDHFGLGALRPKDGLTELDVRMALTQRLENVYQEWKEEWQLEKEIGTSILTSE